MLITFVRIGRGDWLIYGGDFMVYNDVTKQKYKSNTIFMNSEKRKTFHSHVLLLKLNDKLYLQKGEKSADLLNLGLY